MPNVLRLGCIGLSPAMNLPHRALALPTKIFEYYRFGLVVISSDVEGSRIATDGGRLGILLSHDDPVAWVDEIEKLLTDRDYYEHFRDAGLIAAEAEFNWKFEELRLVQYLGRLAGS